MARGVNPYNQFNTPLLILIVILGSTLSSAGEEGGWEEAFAFFYGDRNGNGTRKGACGYDDTISQGYGLENTALSMALFNDGQRCGACYEVKCHNDPKWCHNGSSITISATNYCPPDWGKPSDKGGWCNPRRKHFDLTMPAFLQIAIYEASIVPVLYHHVPCTKKGGIRFEIKPDSNPYWMAVLVFNIAGAGDAQGVRIKGVSSNWATMKRNWGQVWQTQARLVGQALSFEVTASDGRVVQSIDVAPPNWKFGQTFEGKQF